MTELSARALAQLVLDRIETADAYANLTLAEALREQVSMERREKAFATELIYGTVRHRMKLDYILGRLLSRPLKSSALTIKNILRLALYQLLYMPDIPPRAVIHSAVEQAKHSKYSGLAPLVNGVLRNFQRREISLPDPQKEPIAYLSIEYSTPVWLVERWVTQFGMAVTKQILEASNERAPLSVRVNLHNTTVTEATKILNQEDFTIRPGRFLSEALIVEQLAMPIEQSALFNSGGIFPQDESSMLCAHLLQPQSGETVVDLCAAPGGKSTHLAELMNDQGRVYSIDVHPHKVELIRTNARRMQLDSIEPLLADSTNFKLPDGKGADRILVDAPCSGTGVFRRRVDSKYRKNPADIETLVQLQQELLKNAAKLVKPGGYLVYSTCSLEYEEDEAQVQWFLKEHRNYVLEDYHDFLPADLKSYLYQPQEKWAKVLPTPNAGDGFFLSRFKRL